jgi:hypothetical protein
MHLSWRRSRRDLEMGTRTKALCSIFLLLLTAGLAAAPSYSVVDHSFTLVPNAEPSQLQVLPSTIPMNTCVFVGDIYDDFQDALTYLSAVPLAVRSNSTHLTSALLLPDSDSFQTPLEEWLSLAGGACSEAIYIGSVSNPAFLSVGSLADSTIYIDGDDCFEAAAQIATSLFPGTDEVVLVEVLPTSLYSSPQVLYDRADSLPGMTTNYISMTTSQSSNWEAYRTYTPTGGGAIFTLQGADEYIWFDLLSHEDGEYYPMDYPYLDGTTVRFPYNSRSGEQWTLHAIDLYEYSRTEYLDIRVDVPQADFYQFTVNPDEDCVVNFEVDLPSEEAVGLNVLGPDGDIVLSANRFALFSEYGETSSIEASLAHPTPGTYQAYVFSAEASSVSYDITITKNTVTQDWTEATAAAANGASIASALGAPLLFYTSDGLPAEAEAALESLEPETAVVVKPIGDFSYDIVSYLTSAGIQSTTLRSFSEIEDYLELLNVRNPGTGDMILYDSQGAYFSSAGLSAAQRRAVAVPFDYSDSGLMTISQIPEQINWLREYTMPLITTFSFLDAWTDDGRLSGLNPPYETMRDIADAFYSWAPEVAGLNSIPTVITIAPYLQYGNTLPPTFERAIAGKTKPGRYPSADNDATLIQIMRSILRVALQTAPGRSKDAIGSHLVYTYQDGVENNNGYHVYVSNSDQFPSLMSDAGLFPDQEVGPQVVTELSQSPYFWLASTHGGVGGESYDIDGLVGILNWNAYRGYDEGQVPADPDADYDGVVNPPEDYYEGYNVSALVSGVDLNGMFAYFDSCQLASSYAPASMMEAGCDAVVACRIDALIGASDLFERNVIEAMAQDETSLGVAMNDAYDENSHVYSTGFEGVDTYATSSTVGVVGASCIQFIIFGDPDVTLHDHARDPPAFAERVGGFGPGRTIHAHPGSSYDLQLGRRDPVGNIYAFEGDFSIEIYSPTYSLVDSGVVHCTNQSVGSFLFNISSSSALGLYTVEVTELSSAEEFSFGILLEWPVLSVVSTAHGALSQFGYWSLLFSVYNPQDVSVDTVMTVYLGSQVISSTDVEWAPGVTAHAVTLEAAFVGSGVNEISVSIVLKVTSSECCSFSQLVTVSLHWISIALYGVVPVLGIAVAVVGFVSLRRTKRNGALESALNDERSQNYEEAFNAYMDHGLVEGGVRAAVKSGFSEGVLERVTSSPSPQVRSLLSASASDLYSKSDYALAGNVYGAIGDTLNQVRSKIMHSLATGDLASAADLMKEAVDRGHRDFASELLMESSSLGVASRLMEELGSPVLALAALLVQRGSDCTPLLEASNEVHDDGLRLNLWVTFGADDRAVNEISTASSVQEMIEKTAAISDTKRLEIMSDVVSDLATGRNATKINEYLNGLEFPTSSFSQVTKGIVDRLMDKPSNKSLKKLLEDLSKGVPENKEYVREIKDTIEVLQSGGAAVDEAKTVKLVKSVTNPAVADKLIALLHRNRFGTEPLGSAALGALGEYTIRLRTAALGASSEVSTAISTELSSVEPALREKIKQQARSVLPGIEFKPESSWSIHTNIERFVAQAVDVTNPFATLDALAEAAGETGFTELQEMVVAAMNDEESVRAFLRRAMSDPRIRQKLARGRSVQFGGLHVPLSNEQILATIAREEWETKAVYAWKTGVQASAYAVVSKVLASLDRSSPESFDYASTLICQYMRHLDTKALYYKSGSTATFSYLCDAANMTPDEKAEAASRCGIRIHQMSDGAFRNW